MIITIQFAQVHFSLQSLREFIDREQTQLVRAIPNLLPEQYFQRWVRTDGNAHTTVLQNTVMIVSIDVLRILLP